LDWFLSINDAWHVAGEDELALQEMNTDAADRPVFRGRYFALGIWAIAILIMALHCFVSMKQKDGGGGPE